MLNTDKKMCSVDFFFFFFKSVLSFFIGALCWYPVKVKILPPEAAVGKVSLREASFPSLSPLIVLFICFCRLCRSLRACLTLLTQA